MDLALDHDIAPSQSELEITIVTRHNSNRQRNHGYFFLQRVGIAEDEL